MTGAGGWPLNVFLTPEQVPFYAGTYFPPQPRMGMPSWRQVVEAVSNAWEEKKDEIRDGRRAHRRAPARRAPCWPRRRADGPTAGLDAAVEKLGSTYDSVERRLRRRAQVPARVASSSSSCAAGRRR